MVLILLDRCHTPGAFSSLLPLPEHRSLGRGELCPPWHLSVLVPREGLVMLRLFAGCWAVQEGVWLCRLDLCEFLLGARGALGERNPLGDVV